MQLLQLKLSISQLIVSQASLPPLTQLTVLSLLKLLLTLVVKQARLIPLLVLSLISLVDVPSTQDSFGSVAQTFGDEGIVQSNLSDAITITGGQGSTDLVTTSISGTNTGTFTMSGVETLNAGVDSTASTIDLTNVSGLTNLILTDDAATGAQVTVSSLTSSTALTLGDSSNEFKAQKVVATLKDATGTSDSLTVNLVDTDAASSTATIDADGVETLTLALADSTETHKVDLDNNPQVAQSLSLLVLTPQPTSPLLVSRLLTPLSTQVAARFLEPASGARGSAAMTITAGANADHIAMENINDVLDGGDGASDMLGCLLVGGAITVDLSATGDRSLSSTVLLNPMFRKALKM